MTPALLLTISFFCTGKRAITRDQLLWFIQRERTKFR